MSEACEEKLYEVQMTRHSEDALREIALSIATELLAPEAAARWLQNMRDQIRSLSSFPQKIQLTPEEPWHSLGVHRLVVGKYYVYFLIFEECRQVRITDILFQGRNQQEQLLNVPPQDFLPNQ